MNLDIARACIEKAPLTHLGDSAKYVLAKLDASAIERLEAMEAQLAVQALEIARLTKELGAVPRLRKLELAVAEVCGGIPPSGNYARAVFEKIKRHLTPHLG